MRDLRSNIDRFLGLLADHQELVLVARQSLFELDQVLRQRKEICRAGQAPETYAGRVTARAGSDLLTQFRATPPGTSRSSPPEEPTAPTGGGERHNVLLVVEDDPDDFMLLQRAWRKSGEQAVLHWVQTAREALTALSALETGAQIVCVVADVHLPEIDGFELLRLVKNRPSPARLRFAFLTGRRDGPTRQRAQESGADAFFIKPSSHLELVEIARALARLVAEPAE
jgi:CheY-like chemotaxis protein